MLSCPATEDFFRARLDQMIDLLLHIHELPSLIRDWAAMMGRSFIRRLPGRSQPRKGPHHKPHPSQAYKRAA